MTLGTKRGVSKHKNVVRYVVGFPRVEKHVVFHVVLCTVSAQSRPTIAKQTWEHPRRNRCTEGVRHRCRLQGDRARTSNLPSKSSRKPRKQTGMHPGAMLILDIFHFIFVAVPTGSATCVNLLVGGDVVSKHRSECLVGRQAYLIYFRN